MKLTYRGVNYKAPKPDVQPELLVDRAIFDAEHLTSNLTNNQVILVRPIHYYTYRGVSYTKNVFVDSHTKFSLGS
jgi:Domain of unknown function (DUF4278)